MLTHAVTKRQPTVKFIFKNVLLFGFLLYIRNKNFELS